MVFKLQKRYDSHTENYKTAKFCKKNCGGVIVLNFLIVLSCFIFVPSFTKISHRVSVLSINNFHTKILKRGIIR